MPAREALKRRGHHLSAKLEAFAICSGLVSVRSRLRSMRMRGSVHQIRTTVSLPSCKTSPRSSPRISSRSCISACVRQAW